MENSDGHIREFIYEHPPLIEVLMEIRWSLQPFTSIPGAMYDPHWSAFSEAFEAAIATKGFGVVKQLVPQEVPLEFIPYKVVRRFQKSENQWPICQIGPGVMSVNIVPPYAGWRTFVGNLREGLEALWASYPIASEYLRIETVNVRYLNAFSSKHGADKPGAFAREKLGFGSMLPDAIVRHVSGDSRDVMQAGEFTFPLKEPENAAARIAMLHGQVDNTRALIVELDVKTASRMGTTSPAAVIEWCNGAHHVISDWFKAMIPDDVKKTFGQEREV